MNLTRKYREVKSYLRKVPNFSPKFQIWTSNLNNYMCANITSSWHSANWITNIYWSLTNSIFLPDLKIKQKVSSQTYVIYLTIEKIFLNISEMFWKLQLYISICSKNMKMFELKHKCWLMRQKISWYFSIARIVSTDK